MKSNRPYFLWDYNLTEEDVHRILGGENEVEKRWLMSRILEAARFTDVWHYLKLHEVVELFPKLRLREPIARVWRRALKVWGTP